jgi:hypothetical protein
MARVTIQPLTKEEAQLSQCRDAFRVAAPDILRTIREGHLHGIRRNHVAYRLRQLEEALGLQHVVSSTPVKS